MVIDWGVNIRIFLLTLAIVLGFLAISCCINNVAPSSPIEEKPTLSPTAKPTPGDVFATPQPSTTAAYSPIGVWATGKAYGSPYYVTNLQDAKVYRPESGLPPNANEYNGHWMIFTSVGQFRMIDAYSAGESDFMQDVKGTYAIKGDTITLGNRSVMSMSGGQWRSQGSVPDKQYTLSFINEDSMLFDGSTYVKVAVEYMPGTFPQMPLR